MLTPEQIKNQTFTVVRLREAGYQQNEVDDFFDEVLESYNQLLKDRNDALAQAERLGRRAPAPSEQTIALPPVPTAAPTVNGPSLETIGLLLTQAESTASAIKAKAEADAEAVRAKAVDDNAKFLTEVRAKAAQVTAEAEDAAAKLIDDATAKAAEIIAEGNTERYAQIGALEEKRGQLQASVDELTTTRATVVASLTAALDKVRG